MLSLENLGALQSALGWAVLHFLWQGAIIGLVAACGLALLPKENAAARYALGCGALAVALVTFCATFLLSMPDAGVAAPLVALPSSVDIGAPEFAAAAAILAELTAAPGERAFGPSTALAWFWAVGALLMVLRLSRGGFWAHRLRTRSVSPVEASWQRVVDALRLDLGLRRAVRLMKSELVDSPAVVGWLTPMILVPATTFTALTPDQLRSVLAHELAHIRRHDPLANALQALIEITLFFHPVVWWLSRLVREEREHCCDAVAVHATGSSLLLAQALTRLESLRLTSPAVALAAKTHEGPLMTRITRILDVRGAAPQRPIGWRFLSTLGAGALVLGLGVAQAAAAPSYGATPEARLSLEGRDAESDYSIVEARILEAVEAGHLSAADAKRTLGALRRTMLKNERRLPRAVDGSRRTDLGRRIDDSRRDPSAADMKARLRTYERDVRAAVSAGQMSKEQAAARLGDAKKRIADELAARDQRTVYDLRRTERLRRVEDQRRDSNAAEGRRGRTEQHSLERLEALRRDLERHTAERDALAAELADRKAQHGALEGRARIFYDFTAQQTLDSLDALLDEEAVIEAKLRVKEETEREVISKKKAFAKQMRADKKAVAQKKKALAEQMKAEKKAAAQKKKASDLKRKSKSKQKPDTIVRDAWVENEVQWDTRTGTKSKRKSKTKSKPKSESKPKTKGEPKAKGKDLWREGATKKGANSESLR